MRRARLFPPILCLVVAPLALHAQWQASADLGASHLQRTNIPQSGAVTLGGSVTGVGDHGWFRSSLLGVVAGFDQTTGQALMAGSLVGSSERKARGELMGVVSAFGESGGGATLAGELMPRIQFGSGGRGVAFGIGLGVTAHEGSRNALYHWASDAWWGVGDDQFAAGLSAVKTKVTYGTAPYTARLSRSYADLSGGWRRDHGGFVFGATAGLRTGSDFGGDGAWGAADVAAWVFPRTALVLSGGRTLDDPVRGIPRTTFVTLALRVSGQAHQTIARRRVAPGARVTILRVNESQRRIEVRGLTASRIEVMADFTDWNPIALELVGDVWRLERAITPGLHRIALRVDGGEWTAPVNLPHATDDLGGVVGLITVP